MRVRSCSGSLITGNPAAARPFRFARPRRRGRIEQRVNPDRLTRPLTRQLTLRRAGRRTGCRRCRRCRPASNRPQTRPTAHVKLPLVTTAPLASVNVIDPTEVGSGSQPGVDGRRVADARNGPDERHDHQRSDDSREYDDARGVPSLEQPTHRLLPPPLRVLHSYSHVTSQEAIGTKGSSTAKSLGQLAKQAPPRTRTPDARKVNDRNSATCRGPSDGGILRRHRRWRPPRCRPVWTIGQRLRPARSGAGLVTRCRPPPPQRRASDVAVRPA